MFFKSHKASHTFTAARCESRRCDGCSVKNLCTVYHCDDCEDYDLCSGCMYHKAWHSFSRIDAEAGFQCDRCAKWIYYSPCYTCDDCADRPIGYGECAKCFDKSRTSTSVVQARPTNSAAYTPPDPTVYDRRLQAAYVINLKRQWGSGAIAAVSFVSLVASAIMDAIHAVCFLPWAGQLTFAVLRWRHSAKQKLSAVLDKKEQLKAELARRGLVAPKLSLWGKAKAVFKGTYVKNSDRLVRPEDSKISHTLRDDEHDVIEL